ncbi:MAG: hypothetical protein H0W89_04080 [Candidatus Levybacteria bacterium]|nr:hypothetical protein [Candidatus Levybacteria bacterium]
MADPAMQSIVTDVEKELLEAIITNLKAELLTEDQAQQLAKEFLALLPMEDKRDLLDKLYKLSKAHVEAKGVYLKYAKPFEEEDRQRKLTLMSQHIQDGKIEHAINVAKGVAN